MIVLRSPKGWTGPKVVDGLQVEGTFRAHQVPLLVDSEHPDHVKQLESWMKSYKAEELFDENGRSCRNWPSWRRRATGGWAPIRTPTAAFCCATCACRTSTLPRGECAFARRRDGQDTLVLGKFLRDVAKLNQDQRNFRSSVPMRRSRISWARF
jgi:xylulose-5-phosphate/fructose-6-phosphate phosphoketolase